jgi:HEAT repeat protein
MSNTRDIAALCSELDARTEGNARTPLLIELLGLSGHERHEDIVFELGLIGDPAAVTAVEKAAGDPFPYLEEWGNLHEFQRKCAYALARIGTAESRAALERLAKHSDPCLREYGQEGLAHWPLPLKAR